MRGTPSATSGSPVGDTARDRTRNMLCAPRTLETVSRRVNMSCCHARRAPRVDRSCGSGGSGLNAEPFEKCAYAFVRRDYPEVVSIALGLLETGVSFPLAQILLISMRRLGMSREIQDIGSMV